MKIHIWIKKEDALSGNITEYYAANPYKVGEMHPRLEYIQVSITPDEFARLEDKTTKGVMGPAIGLENMTELELRMYNESQSVTGGEFSDWHRNLTTEEQQIYTRIYGH